jgi:peroxin-12
LQVGIPYIRARSQDYFERLGGGIDANAIPHENDGQAVQLAGTHSVGYSPRTRLSDQTIRRKARSAFKFAYPYANLAWELYLLGYDIGYMFDRTPRWRPWFTLLGVKLERAQPPSPVCFCYRMTRGLRRQPSPDVKRSVASYLPPLLPPLLLLLKFSQWYYSPTSPFSIFAASKKPDASSMHSRIAPPPPLPVIKTHGAQEWPYGTCPVCENAWQNPTALPTGWVMCWRCAWEAIDETETCPMTGAIVYKDDLRRVLV